MPDDTEKQFMIDLGARLEMAIQAVGLTQAEAARNLDVSPSKFGHWIQGRHYPNPYTVKRFCDRYGITADWIYRGQVSALPHDLGDVLSGATRASSGALQEASRQVPSPTKPRGRPPKKCE